VARLRAVGTRTSRAHGQLAHVARLKVGEAGDDGSEGDGGRRRLLRHQRHRCRPGLRDRGDGRLLHVGLGQEADGFTRSGEDPAVGDFVLVGLQQGELIARNGTQLAHVDAVEVGEHHAARPLHREQAVLGHEARAPVGGGHDDPALGRVGAQAHDHAVALLEGALRIAAGRVRRERARRDGLHWGLSAAMLEPNPIADTRPRFLRGLGRAPLSRIWWVPVVGLHPQSQRPGRGDDAKAATDHSAMAWGDDKDSGAMPAVPDRCATAAVFFACRSAVLRPSRGRPAQKRRPRAQIAPISSACRARERSRLGEPC
jgi:hypothetical protein